VSNSYEQRKTQQNVFGLVLAAACVIAAPAVLFGWFLHRWAQRGDRKPVLIVALLLGMGLLYLLRERIWFALEDMGLALVDVDVDMLLEDGVWLWLLTLPATPLLALFIDAGKRRNPEQQELDAQARKRAKLLRGRERATQRVATAPEHLGGALVLGGAGEGDLVQCVKDGFFLVPTTLLHRHVIAVGGSGMGKTETILKIAVGAASLHGWRVVYLDFKGDQATATRFAHALHLQGKRVAVYPDQSYDGWRGGANELLNRLMEVIEYSEPYYKSVAKLMLSLACFAPDGPPRSSDELLARLRKPELLTLYKDRPEAVDVEAIPAKDAAGVYNRYRSFFYALGDKLNGAWAFEDVEACYVRVDATALKEEGQSLGRYLLEDFTQYVAYRKPQDEHVLLVVDELSAISKTNVNVDNLFERMRSFNAHIIVSAQGYAGLGEEAERMLDAAGTIILHAADKPDDLIARAGTIKVVERSVQKDTLGATGAGSLRAQEAFRVNPNDAGQLGAGECFIISGRRAQWVKVKRIELKPVLVKTNTSPVAERMRAKYQQRVASAVAQAEACEPPPSNAAGDVEPSQAAAYDERANTELPDYLKKQ